MPYTIYFSSNAQKEYLGLQKNKKIFVRIRNKINSLKDNPFTGKALVGKLKGLYSLRISDFRIIYDIVNHDVNILSIKNRREVYR